MRALVRFFNTKHYGAYAPHLHRRSSSANHQPASLFPGNGAPTSTAGPNVVSEHDPFPPHRTVGSFDYDYSPSYSQDSTEDNTEEYEIDDLLSPSTEGDNELETGPLASRAAWDRLGDLLGHFDEISDSESVGSFGFLDFGRDNESDGSVSDLDMEEELVDERQNRNEWEQIRLVPSLMPSRPEADPESTVRKRLLRWRKSATRTRLSLALLDHGTVAAARDPSRPPFDPSSSTATTTGAQETRRSMDQRQLSPTLGQLSMRWSWYSDDRCACNGTHRRCQYHRRRRTMGSTGTGVGTDRLAGPARATSMTGRRT